MTILDFRIGDVFEPDDDLSLWFCTIALAFNDIVITHVRADEASEEWEQFYFARVGIGHYTEILLYMEREDPKPGNPSLHLKPVAQSAEPVPRDTGDV